MRKIFFISATFFLIVFTTVAVIWAKRIERHNQLLRAPQCLPTTFRRISVTRTGIRAEVSDNRFYIIDSVKQTVSLHGPDIPPLEIPDGIIASTDSETANDFLNLKSWAGTDATFILKHEALTAASDESNKSFQCDFTVHGTWSD